MSLKTHGDASSDATQPQRLNRFQQAMGLWETLQPYNAGHVLRLKCRFDRERLQQVIQQQCQACGIESLELNKEKTQFAYKSLDFVNVDVRDWSGDFDTELESDLSRELNFEFPEFAHHPLRWIVYVSPRENEWILAVVYHHLASDAHGIMVLLAGIVRAYLGESIDDTRLQLTTRAQPYRLDHKGSASRFGIIRSFFAMSRSYFAMRQAHRLHEHRDSNDATSLVTRPVPDGFAGALAARCKKADAGVNDAFLAAMTQTFAERTPARRKHNRRKKVALASAVNLRPWSRDDLSACFGTYVGHSIILIDNPDADFDTLLSHVKHQTNMHKQQRRAAGPAWPLIFAKYLWPILRIPNNTGSYRKLYPLCAGISNVRVDATLFGTSASSIIDYTRICPPGPAMPMVLAPTTFNGTMQLSLVYREGALTTQEARDMLDRVLEILMSFASFELQSAPIPAPAATTPAKPKPRTEPVPAQR